MCGLNFGNNGCCWILILILLFSVCGNNSGVGGVNDSNCGCGCGNNNNNNCCC